VALPVKTPDEKNLFAYMVKDHIANAPHRMGSYGNIDFNHFQRSWNLKVFENLQEGDNAKSLNYKSARHLEEYYKEVQRKNNAITSYHQVGAADHTLCASWRPEWRQADDERHAFQQAPFTAQFASPPRMGLCPEITEGDPVNQALVHVPTLGAARSDDPYALRAECCSGRAESVPKRQKQARSARNKPDNLNVVGRAVTSST